MVKLNNALRDTTVLAVTAEIEFRVRCIQPLCHLSKVVKQDISLIGRVFYTKASGRDKLAAWTPAPSGLTPRPRRRPAHLGDPRGLPRPVDRPARPAPRMAVRPGASLTGRSSAPIKRLQRGPSRVRALRFGRSAKGFGEARSAKRSLTGKSRPEGERAGRTIERFGRKGKSHLRVSLGANTWPGSNARKKCSQSSRPAASNTALPPTM